MRAVTPGPHSLQIILERCGIALEADQLEKLWRYHQMLRRANVTLNLTRIHNFENMVIKHYVDSLLVLEYPRAALATDRHGLGCGFAGDSTQDRPA